MSAVPPDRRRISLAEYLAWEARSGGKHEFYRGEVFAMAGASLRHNRIATNILARLYQSLEGGPCEVFGSDQRIRIDAVDLSTYPDVSVICGGVQVDAVDRHGVTNPRVIVEVLSKSTENYDRGRKFEFYQHLQSFMEYVLVYQDEPKVIHYVREDNGRWSYKLLVGEQETLRLESIDSELPFAAVYRNVKFGPEEEEAEDARRPV
ncbi:MAG: Uma2 family endonuclease [Pirellulaceae bacterium]